MSSQIEISGLVRFSKTTAAFRFDDGREIDLTPMNASEDTRKILLAILGVGIESLGESIKQPDPPPPDEHKLAGCSTIEVMAALQRADEFLRRSKQNQ